MWKEQVNNCKICEGNDTKRCCRCCRLHQCRCWWNSVIANSKIRNHLFNQKLIGMDNIKYMLFLTITTHYILSTVSCVCAVKKLALANIATSICSPLNLFQRNALLFYYFSSFWSYMILITKTNAKIWQSSKASNMIGQVIKYYPGKTTTGYINTREWNYLSVEDVTVLNEISYPWNHMLELSVCK